MGISRDSRSMRESRAQASRKVRVKMHRPLIGIDGSSLYFSVTARVLQKSGRADMHRKPPDCLSV